MAKGVDIEPGYYSLGVAKSEESSVNTLSDAKGKTVCFSDPASTGGYLFPAKGLVEAGIDPKVETTQDISPVFAGTSASAGIAVVEGECELGFIVDTSLRFAESKGDIKPGALKTVWKSGLITGVPLVVNKNLPSDLISEISNLVLKSANKTAFVESGVCKDEATCSYLIPSNWGFVKKDDSYFDPIRDVCAALGNKRCT
jgi:phosphonate transport system substrate-binding protein